MKLTLALLFPLLLTTVSKAQTVTTATVADADTHQPVAHASLYCKEGGRFRSSISDAQGVARIAFSFQRLTVSHLNYEKLTLRQLPDTIFLKPRFLTKAEVIVTNKEPEWIRRKLRQAIRLKDRNYFTHDGCENFVYDTQSTGTNSIYRFHLSGLLRPKSNLHEHFALIADSALITAADSTRLTDMANLRRMLYEDFMADLDNSFVRSHRFYENPSAADGTTVELRFRAKEYGEDHGWMVIDTTSCKVLSAYRFTDKNANRQERISDGIWTMARALGYHIDQWKREYRVVYAERTDGTLYPTEVRYKTFFVSDGAFDPGEQQYSELTGGGFANMEATLTLTPSDEAPDDYTQWFSIPRPWYVRISSDSQRREEIHLSNLPAAFKLFEEETE